MMSKNKKKQGKKGYSKPMVNVVKIDNQITTFMMTLPPDAGFNTPENEPNPYKITNLG